MPKHYSFTFIITLILYLLCTSLAEAQQRRPKIGLVLSGGGAKGLAHIGVLKAMEKAGLRPDYITGTSMGSVIGGLYSIGYSADQIEKMVNEISWDEILANNIRLNKIVMEEKPYYGRYMVELPTDNFKPQLPSGVIEGQNLQELFFDLTRRVHNINDFNKFPIPFACIGADIATGKPVIMDHGNLARSIRASMAIPAVFTPVEIDGKLLVDGGLVNNFPVDLVKQMGADIVIGVFVGSDLLGKESLKSLGSILFQSSFVMSAYNYRDQKQKVNYYVEPDLAGFGAASFSSASKIVAQGIKKGDEYFPVFKNLADSLNNIAPQAPLTQIPQPDSYLIKKTDVAGNELLPSPFITAKFKMKDSVHYSSDQIDEKISILFGRGYFDNIGYQLYGQEDSGYNLMIQVKEAVPSKIKAAFHFDTENKAGININYTLRNKIGKGSRLILETDLAEFPRLSANYLKYLGNKQNLAAVADFVYSRFEPVIKDETSRKGVYSISEYSFTGSLITTYATNHNYGLDISYSSLKLKPEATDDATRVIKYLKNKELSARLYFHLDNMEKRYFKSYGSNLLISGEYFFGSTGKFSVEMDSISAEEKYTIPNIKRIELLYQRVMPVRKNISVSATAGLTFADHDSTGNFYTAGVVFFGGFHPRIRGSAAFYGANNFDYTTSSYMVGKLDVQAQLMKHLFLTAGINYLNIRQPMEWLFKGYQQAGDLGNYETWRLGYGISLGYMTLIGPISVSLGMDQKKGIPVANFSLGFYF